MGHTYELILKVIWEIRFSEHCEIWIFGFFDKWVCPIVNAKAGRLLSAYDLEVATPRAVIHAGDKTSGNARSWYMISGDAKSWVFNPRSASPPYQHLSPPTDYQTAPPTTPIESPPSSPKAPLGFSPSLLLNTLKTTPPPLTSPPPIPSQHSKQNSPIAINLEPVELIFSTPPTSHHAFFNSLEDLPPRTTNPPPPQPSFDSIKRLENQPPPLPEVMEPSLLPLPPHLPPLSQPVWSNDAFLTLTHEMFFKNCQRTQVLINDLRGVMRFILNHILERLNVFFH
uniref:Uncharacterized protein n=1 Tax=Tanacetum cinerariifolium TaxID=118510 RepID=A0A699GJJ7_TANCI|nr:hypothetical protein [Tanacetum cinerariifolium]